MMLKAVRTVPVGSAVAARASDPVQRQRSGAEPLSSWLIVRWKWESGSIVNTGRFGGSCGIGCFLRGCWDMTWLMEPGSATQSTRSSLVSVWSAFLMWLLCTSVVMRLSLRASLLEVGLVLRVREEGSGMEGS
jgi:hypothetical protein